MCYKNITIVNDNSRVIRMMIVSDATSWRVTYGRNYAPTFFLMKIEKNEMRKVSSKFCHEMAVWVEASFCQLSVKNK
jgi:hypothetical protein